MRVSRTLFGFLVVASCQSFVTADDAISDSGVVLGPVIPIGVLERQVSIITVQHAAPKLESVIPQEGVVATVPRALSAMPRLQATNHDLGLSPSEASATSAPQVHPAQPRVIREPMVAPTIQMVHRVAPVAQRPAVHPDQVQAHLMTAIQSLQTAGLADEANQVLAIQQRFVQRHYQDLLVAHKESQIQVLRAEIARLKQSPAVAADAQVELKLQVVRVNHDQRTELVNSLRKMCSLRAPSAALGPVQDSMMDGVHCVEVQALQTAIDNLVSKNAARSVVLRTVTVLNGRKVQFFLDPRSENIPFVAVQPRDQTPLLESRSAVEICPNAAPNGVIRSTVNIGVSCQVPTENIGQDDRRAMKCGSNATIEVAPGRALTLVLPKEVGMGGPSNPELATCDLIVVSPSVIQVPATMTIPSPRAFQVQYSTSKAAEEVVPVIEAKATSPSTDVR